MTFSEDEINVNKYVKNILFNQNYMIKLTKGIWFYMRRI